MNLLFLDIDGVLNQHEPLHPEVMCGNIHDDKVHRLNLILAETGAKIVLSSAWRYIVHRGEMNLAGMGWLLRSHGILDRLVGITRPDTMMPAMFTGKEAWPVENERGQQIADYLAVNPCSRYVVLDDLDLGISKAGHPFVHVNGAVGLWSNDVADAVAKLSGETLCP